MLVHEGVLLEAFGMATDMQSLWAVTFMLACAEVIAEADGLSITIGWYATSQASRHRALPCLSGLVARLVLRVLLRRWLG